MRGEEGDRGGVEGLTGGVVERREMSILATEVNDISSQVKW
jgi:hypothetical protein